MRVGWQLSRSPDKSSGLMTSTMTHSRVAASMQEGGKASFTDKAKAYAVKAIDHTNAALEGAKQKVRALSCCTSTSSRISSMPAALFSVTAVLACRWPAQASSVSALQPVCCATKLSV